jgi:hypothetical protein
MGEWLGMVIHVYNPSYLGDGDKRITVGGHELKKLNAKGITQLIGK